MLSIKINKVVPMDDMKLLVFLKTALSNSSMSER